MWGVREQPTVRQASHSSTYNCKDQLRAETIFIACDTLKRRQHQAWIPWNTSTTFNTSPQILWGKKDQPSEAGNQLRPREFRNDANATAYGLREEVLISLGVSICVGVNVLPWRFE